MDKKINCKICDSACDEDKCSFDGERHFINCPICGTYVLPLTSTIRKDNKSIVDFGAVYDFKKLTTYLYHHKNNQMWAFIGSEEVLKQYKTKAPRARIFLVTPETVDNWYPKTFEEKVNIILLQWAKQSKFTGDSVRINIAEFNSFFLLYNTPNSDDWKRELKFILGYLCSEEIIESPISMDKFGDYITGVMLRGFATFTLSAKGWSKVYDLQKNHYSSKKAFVAMKFGDETIELRNMIRKGVEAAGYEAIFMDEIEHNRQIVPEMLNAIKTSRFVVAELSHHNNGAYYEAGYAHGLNKEVIHICSEEALTKDLHFDVEQICCVKYTKLDQIPERLKNRIDATILK